MVTREHLFRDSKLIVRAQHDDIFNGDAALLKEPTPVDTMGGDTFPQWFWRETYTNVRHHAEAVHQGQPLIEIWRDIHKPLEGDKTQASTISNMGVLGNFAHSHESSRYAIKLSLIHI